MCAQLAAVQARLQTEQAAAAAARVAQSEAEACAERLLGELEDARARLAADAEPAIEVAGNAAEPEVRPCCAGPWRGPEETSTGGGEREKRTCHEMGSNVQPVPLARPDARVRRSSDDARARARRAATLPWLDPEPPPRRPRASWARSSARSTSARACTGCAPPRAATILGTFSELCFATFRPAHPCAAAACDAQRCIAVQRAQRTRGGFAACAFDWVRAALRG